MTPFHILICIEHPIIYSFEKERALLRNMHIIQVKIEKQWKLHATENLCTIRLWCNYIREVRNAVTDSRLEILCVDSRIRMFSTF